MSFRRYCVLWMPTKFHKSLRPIYNNPVEEGGVETVLSEEEIDNEIDVEDDITYSNICTSDDETPKIYIDLTLHKKDFFPDSLERATYHRLKENDIPLRHISIVAKKEDGEIIETLFLECIDARSNGLFQFSYIVDDHYLSETGTGKYLLNSQYNITNALYHNIKSFFHKHEFHGKIKDSILCPFSSAQPINLTQNNNTALLHYLEEFSKVLVDEYSNIKELNNQLIEYYKGIKRRINNQGYEDENELKVLLIKRDIYLSDLFNDCIRQCTNALNKHIYFQSLLFSQYNKVCQIGYSPISNYNIRVYPPFSIGYDSYYISACPDSTSWHSLIVFPYRYTDDYDYYKSALNVNNAIELIRLLRESIIQFVSKETFELNKILLNTTAAQIDELRTLNIQIREQGRDIKGQGEEIKSISRRSSNISTKLAIFGIVITVIIAVITYVLTPNNEGIINNQNLILEKIEKLERSNSVLSEPSNLYKSRKEEKIEAVTDSVGKLSDGKSTASGGIVRGINE